MVTLDKDRKARRGWELARISWALYGYQQARGRGEKYEAALDAGVAAVKARYPAMPMSVTEMKRILAEVSPSGCSETLQFWMDGKELVARVSPPPEYPRVNARIGREPGLSL